MIKKSILKAAKKIRQRWRRTHIRIRKKQQAPVELPTIDETQHTCKHCNYTYVGRQCPMCGMPGSWTRFTWKKLFNGFLDIWGMGNRPMFRSMGHLFWRPGYMIRDYLNGHYLSYFPPFKMLAVLTIFVVTVIWLLGIETNVSDASLIDSSSDSIYHYGIFKVVVNVLNFLKSNPLYSLLLQIVMLVLAVWIVFRKKGYNLVETFFAMVYLSCQMQMIVLIWLLLTQQFIHTSVFPYKLPQTLVIVLLIYDFRQLYGLKIWGSVWHTLLMVLLLIMLYIVFIAIIVILLTIGIVMEQYLFS